jgi:hypothetical protein
MYRLAASIERCRRHRDVHEGLRRALAPFLMERRCAVVFARSKVRTIRIEGQPMTRRFASCLAIALLTFMAPRPAAATSPITTFFDAVDAVELGPADDGFSVHAIKVTGVVVGATAPTTHTFTFAPDTTGADQARRCELYAVLAMSKPGKFRFGIEANGSVAYASCKLIRRTP